MRWTCPKCGKKLDISNEQLVANDGVIICPQCLLQARQPVPTARVAARYDEVSKSRKTPPPHRSGSNTSASNQQRMKPAKTSYRYTGVSSNNGTVKKKNTKKKSKKKKGNDGMSALGCLGRTVVFTIVLFAAYVIFGLLLESLQ